MLCGVESASVRRKAVSESLPSTCTKQLVVCPIPDGRIRSFNMAFITVLFPLDVLKCDMESMINSRKMTYLMREMSHRKFQVVIHGITYNIGYRY